jgi:Spy/CpxP family protein refolding chaperone
MKVESDRSGLVLEHRSRIRRGAVALAIGTAVGTAMVLIFAASPVAAQSPGIEFLRQGNHRPSAHAGRKTDSPSRLERDRQAHREARGRAMRHRAEQREANERAMRATNGSKLSPDERRKLRQSLHDLGREMYKGG